MRAIIVDDEPIMAQRFVRLSKGIADINLVGQFENGEDALKYAEEHPVDLAFLDIDMPVMNGIQLAQRLRALRGDVLIVFVTAYDEYIRDSNQIGGDYYIIKPYNRETLEMMMERIRLIGRRQQKQLYIQTFGRFLVLQDGKPVRLTGKAKEILAYVTVHRGKEVSNEEIYSTIWEGRTYSNAHMVVYYNALRRLKLALAQAGLEALLISTKHGQIINTAMFDCDYYAWQDQNLGSNERFEGKFLTEYSWGEVYLAEMLSLNQ
ncbi:MAG: response regulator [Clostridia bacterium]|nr:response regulator [Clostridia bacterium]